MSKTSYIICIQNMVNIFANELTTENFLGIPCLLYIWHRCANLLDESARRMNGFKGDFGEEQLRIGNTQSSQLSA